MVSFRILFTDKVTLSCKYTPSLGLAMTLGPMLRPFQLEIRPDHWT